MEHYVMEFKAESISWVGCNLWENNDVEFFDLTGYFRSMLRKAERGELHLHKSVFDILKRSQ
jgi:hypothetical protein